MTDAASHGDGRFWIGTLDQLTAREIHESEVLDLNLPQWDLSAATTEHGKAKPAALPEFRHG